MRFRPLAAAAILSSLTFASGASAQGGPMSVGLADDPALRSLHCAAALFMERYLIQEEKLASPFDGDALQAGAKAWAESAASLAGQEPGAFIQGQVFLAVSEQKLNSDALRQAQVKWCLARTPPG
ncbi:MAG: hypothetical protein Q7T61_12405 [Caulobacter sp.]|nr:hypothetical protein [Caulobacter sp.]